MSMALATVLATAFTGAPLQPIQIEALLVWQFERKASTPVACLHESQSKTPVQATGCTAVGNHQSWHFISQGNRQFEIRNVRTGGCLDIEGASPWRGARVIDWPCHGRGLREEPARAEDHRDRAHRVGLDPHDPGGGWHRLRHGARVVQRRRSALSQTQPT